MNLHEALAFTLFAWTCIMTPGPNVAIATTTGVNHGFKAAFPQALGVPLGTILMLWGIGLFADWIFGASAWLIWSLKAAGVGYMLYLAGRILRSTSLAERDSMTPLSVIQTMLFQAVNPKVWMMLMAAISTYALGREELHARLAFMSIGFALPSVTSVLLWAWTGDRLRGWLKVGKRLRVFNFVMGTTLALIAIWMLFI